MRRLAGSQGEHVRPKRAGSGAAAAVAAASSRPQQFGVVARPGWQRRRWLEAAQDASTQARGAPTGRVGGMAGRRACPLPRHPPTRPQPALRLHVGRRCRSRKEHGRAAPERAPRPPWSAPKGRWGEGATVTAAVTQTATGPPATAPLCPPPPPPPTPISSTSLRSSSNPLPSATHLSPSSFPSGGRKSGGQRRGRGGEGNDVGEQQPTASVRDSAGATRRGRDTGTRGGQGSGAGGRGGCRGRGARGLGCSGCGGSGGGSGGGNVRSSVGGSVGGSTGRQRRRQRRRRRRRRRRWRRRRRR